MTVLSTFDNWRRRRAGGRAQNHRVVLRYEEKTIRDYVDEAVERMPTDLTRATITIKVPMQFSVTRTA